MNRRFVVLGLAVVMCGTVVEGQNTTSDAAQASPNVQLVGLWDSQTTSMGGIGTTLELRADGTYVEAITVIVNVYYRVSADQLRVAEQVEALDGAPAARFSLEGDALQMPGPGGVVMRKERVGKPLSGQPAIVGIWRYRHTSGAEAFERYTEDGKLFFRLPIKSSVGRQRDLDITVVAGGDGLSVTRDGRTTNYRRDIAGPWYDREHISTPTGVTLPKN